MTRRILLWLFVLTALLALACVKRSQTGETHVGRGEPFRTGQMAFDEFFEDVNTLQRDTKSIKPDEAKALGRIGTVLGLSQPSVQTVFVGVKERVRTFAEAKKGKAFFVLEGIDDHGRPLPGKQITVTASGPRGRAAAKDAQDFAAALDEAAKGVGQLADKTYPMAEKARHRISEADRLRAQIDSEFSSNNKRQEVEREIDAAKKVLADIAQTCDQASAATSGFLVDSRQLFASVAVSKKGKAKKTGGKRSKAPADADFNP
jgi:hypothetical protein